MANRFLRPFLASILLTGVAVVSGAPSPASSSTFQPTSLDQVTAVSGPGSASARSVATDRAGNRYVVGTITGSTTVASTIDVESGRPIDVRSLDTTTTNGSEMFVAKYSQTGSLEWMAKVTSDFWVQGYSVDANADGHIVVTGRFLGTAELASAVSATTGGPISPITVSAVSRSAGVAATALGETFVARYTTNGVVDWVTTASNANQYNEAMSVAIDGNGNVFVTGHMWTANTPSYGEFRSATSSATGQPVDQKTLSISIGTYLDVFLAKYDERGSLQWVATASTWAEDISYSVDVGSDGNPVIAGTFALANLVMASARRPSDGNPTPDNGTAVSADSISLPIGGFRDCFVAKYHSDGTLLWATQLGVGGEERCKAVDVGPDDRVRVAGIFAGTVMVASAVSAATGSRVSPLQLQAQSSGGLDVIVMSFTSTGILEWMASGGSPINEDAWSIAGTPDGGVVVSSRLAQISTMSSAVSATSGSPVDDATTTVEGPTGASTGTMVARFDRDGRLTWLTAVRSSSDVSLEDVVVDSGNRVHAAGTLTGTLQAPLNETIPNITSASTDALLINWGRTPRPLITFVPPPIVTGPSTTAPPATTAPSPVADRNGDLPVRRPGVGSAAEGEDDVAVEVFVENRTDLVMRSQEFELRVKGECDDGCDITTSPEGREVIVLQERGSAAVSGFGFLPGSLVYVWLFSEPRLLGELTVGADGTFVGQVQLGDIAPGEHTLQVNGTSFDGLNRSANLGVLVSPMEMTLPVTGGSDDTAPWLLTFLVAGVLLTYLSRRSRPLSS